MSLENVQARARSPYVWMLANLEGKILITTSNRSEAAVGYATMDGDTSGCLAPIAGVDKPTIIKFLEFMETTGISANIIAHGRGPQSCLSVITKQKPKAELKPVSFAQTDEGDLMPYPVLNYIENLMIQDRRGPLDIYELLLEARSMGTAVFTPSPNHRRGSLGSQVLHAVCPESMEAGKVRSQLSPGLAQLGSAHLVAHPFLTPDTGKNWPRSPKRGSSTPSRRIEPRNNWFHEVKRIANECKSDVFGCFWPHAYEAADGRYFETGHRTEPLFRPAQSSGKTGGHLNFPHSGLQ